MKRVLGMVLAMAMLPAAAPALVQVELPAPTGKQRVGTVSLHLVDNSREDPLAPTARPRELMVRLWYPAARSHRPRAGYLPPASAGLLVGQFNAASGTDYPADLLTFPTHSLAGAPAEGTRHPVVLLSPGFGLNAAFHTGLAEELASRGYVVAGIDHTFDAEVVEFPGGRLEFRNIEEVDDFDLGLATRVADIRFVLDRLTGLAAERRRLPAGLGRAMDLSRVAAVGYSRGSSSTVGVIAADERFDVGVALDGNPIGQVSLDRPFLLLGNQHHRRVEDPDWAAFYDRLRGPRLHAVVDGTEHADFTDFTVFKETLDLSVVFPELGPLDGTRALAIQRRYVTAWLDLALRGRHNPLLAGESREYPEVDFQQ